MNVSFIVIQKRDKKDLPSNLNYKSADSVQILKSFLILYKFYGRDLFSYETTDISALINKTRKNTSKLIVLKLGCVFVAFIISGFYS